MDRVTSFVDDDASITVVLREDDLLEKAFLRVWRILRSKGDDYEGDRPFGATFDAVGDTVGLSAHRVADMFEMTKLDRIRNLLRPGNSVVKHESVEDSYLDKAAYAMLAFALYLRDNR